MSTAKTSRTAARLSCDPVFVDLHHPVDNILMDLLTEVFEVSTSVITGQHCHCCLAMEGDETYQQSRQFSRPVTPVTPVTLAVVHCLVLKVTECLHLPSRKFLNYFYRISESLLAGLRALVQINSSLFRIAVGHTVRLNSCIEVRNHHQTCL